MHYHYYPYGLKIATLSAKKLADVYEGVVKNNYLYQGAFAELDEDIQWTDFPLRNYDAQIGRWVQQDPYQQFASPYTGMGDDPANNIDPSGGIVPGGISGLSTTAEKAITLGEVVVSASKASSIVVKSSNTLMKVASLSANVFKVTNIINGAVTTFPVGIGPGDGLLDFPKNVSDFINTISTTTGYFSLPADAIKNLGGFDRAMKLFKEGKFTANFNDVSKVWSLKFFGNKNVSAEFVELSKKNFELLAKGEYEIFKGAKIAGTIFTWAGAASSLAAFLDKPNAETTADVIMSGVAFIPGWGWIASGGYFAFKQVFEYGKLSPVEQSKRKDFLEQNHDIILKTNLEILCNKFSP